MRAIPFLNCKLESNRVREKYNHRHTCIRCKGSLACSRTQQAAHSIKPPIHSTHLYKGSPAADGPSFGHEGHLSTPAKSPRPSNRMSSCRYTSRNGIHSRSGRSFEETMSLRISSTRLRRTHGGRISFGCHFGPNVGTPRRKILCSHMKELFANVIVDRWVPFVNRLRHGGRSSALLW